MPYSDALLYLHGSGSSAGQPVTSTAKSFTGSIAVTGVLTITAGAAGAELLVGDLLAGANIATTLNGVPTPTIVESITAITAANGVGTYVVSYPQLSNSATITATPPLIGDLISVGAVSQYSNLEIDFGAPNTGASYPWLPQFPSLTEKGYSFAPENVGQGGIEMGVHIIITGPVYGNGTTGARVDVTTAATASATTVITSRTFVIAQLQVQGAHYFIPVPMADVLEFLRFNWVNIGAANGYVGSIIAWFGPRVGGEL